jgi:K+-sensing histidine kinase KdpD
MTRSSDQGDGDFDMPASRTETTTTANDAEAASVAQLEEQVARLSRRVEIGIAHLSSPATLKSGDVGQSGRRSNRPRRKSSVVEELVRQVQQLTDSLAETDAAMEEQKQSSMKLRDNSVGFMLALSYADLISDLVLAVSLLRGAQVSYGVASLVILGILSVVVQLVTVRFYAKKPWLSKDTLLTAVCLGPALSAYRQFAGEPAGPPGAASAVQTFCALKTI